MFSTRFSFVVFAWLLVFGSAAVAADSEEANRKLLRGEYEACIEMSREAMDARFYREAWPFLLTKALLATGKYAEALDVMEDALLRFRSSLRLRLLAQDVYRRNGKKEEAQALLHQINQLAVGRRWIDDDARELVLVGQAAQLLGADPRLVLENFFNQAKQVDPKLRDPYLAIGELALDKSDFELAAQTYRDALKEFPKDPEFLYGLAKAYAPTSRSAMMEHLNAALAENSRHVPSLLLMTEHWIDAEDYDMANETIERVLAVNPVSPEAWAYRAGIAHIHNDSAGERTARETALQFWKSNPEVDHLIGKKLSQKYRFSEGAGYQRQALRFDPDYLPAKIQLAQDLLRLGDEEEGWTLAEQVHEADGYDVVAYNLVTLRETLAKFQVLSNQHFVVRMDPHEAAVYGRRVTSLLDRAKESLCGRYGLDLEESTLVEIFPEQKDFAVRTFGMPGGDGYLGVCFGRVITANSPASQSANPVNWEAVLWHEFCHVVTLQLTKNKMPRWLSEGISVYEEGKANPAWGQTMDPPYRGMILKGELTPVSQLSSAFLAPKSGLHLQFAYFQSALVVEHLIERYGMAALKRVLADLGEGIPINRAIEAHTAPMEQIEAEFAAFARQRAEELGPGLEWKEPSPSEWPADPDRALKVFPNNFWVLRRAARQFIELKRWADAERILMKLIEAYPEQRGPESAYGFLAQVYRSMKDAASGPEEQAQYAEKERQVLAKWAVVDAGALEAYSRLMELESAKEGWSAVLAHAERYLAVNPLVAMPHRYLGRAAEALGQTEEASLAYRTVLRFDPADVAHLHFRVAKLLHATGAEEAKRHVLQALEEAPRFRDAQQLLLKIRRERSNSEEASGGPEPRAHAFE